MTAMLTRVFSVICIAVLMAIGAAASTQNDIACSVTQIATDSHDCTFADFNRDRKPDAAFSPTLGYRASRFIEIRVDLAGFDTDQILQLESNRFASGITSRDVDDDNDVDLILTTSFDNPVAVFLNDGRGVFSFDTHDHYLNSAGYFSESVFAPGSNSDTSLVIDDTQLQEISEQNCKNHFVGNTQHSRLICQDCYWSSHPQFSKLVQIRAP